jgi:pSer/pThr/pTyr-binding forkhead associated (FHA) protein
VTRADIDTSVAELRWKGPQARSSRPGSNAAAEGEGAERGSANARPAAHHANLNLHQDPLVNTDSASTGTVSVGRVIVATEGRTTQELPLKVGRIIIGRTADNDLQVDSRFVSRHHCQIITGIEGSVIEDLNSTNGIFVQGKRVRRYNLNDGDIVVIGKHEIMYLDERAARARVMPAESASSRVPTLEADGDDERHVETMVDTSERAANAK